MKKYLHTTFILFGTVFSSYAQDSCDCGSGTGSSNCRLRNSCTVDDDYDGDITVTDGKVTIQADVSGTVNVTNEDAEVTFKGDITIGGLKIGEEATIRIIGGANVNVAGNIDYTGEEDGSLRVNGTLNVNGDITSRRGEAREDNTISTPGSGVINLSGDCELDDCGSINLVFGSLSLLPVELLSFTVENKWNNYYDISWSTASEVNNEFFTISESIDGINWKDLMTIEGAGTTKETRYYTRTVLSKISGVDLKYVRLSQTDFDGTTEIFPLVLIQGQSTPPDIKVYPNPLTNREFHINTGSAELQEVELFNLSGHVVFHSAAVSFGSDQYFTLPSRLTTGLYPLFIRMIDGQEIKINLYILDRNNQ